MATLSAGRKARRLTGGPDEVARFGAISTARPLLAGERMRDRRIQWLAALLAAGGCVGEPDGEIGGGAAAAPAIRVVRQDRVGDATTGDLAAAGAGDPAALATFFEEVPLAEGIDTTLLCAPTVELREGGWIEVYSFWDGIDGDDDGLHRLLARSRECNPDHPEWACEQSGETT